MGTVPGGFVNKLQRGFVLLAFVSRRWSFLIATGVVLILAGPGGFVRPLLAAVGTGTSNTTTVDTRAPYIILDQIPDHAIYQGGETVAFHWRTGDPFPGQNPGLFSATVWIGSLPDTTIIYHPQTNDFTWEWIVPEITSGGVYLEVRAGDAAGNMSNATTNSFTILSSATSVPRLPGGLTLAPAAPNPFNPSTRLSFHLPESGLAKVSVYDARGLRIRTLLREMLPEGDFWVEWDGKDGQGRTQPGGVYLFSLEFEGGRHHGRITRKAVLVP
jgi:hypothetical protein